MILSIYDNRKFSKISGDKNKIHIKKEIAEKFFIKKPIVHGCNVLLKIFKKTNFLNNNLDTLEIYFKDYINVNEIFGINLKKNSILISGKYNNKIEIKKKFDKRKKTLEKKQVFDELIFISKYIGNIYPGENSIIQQIKLSSSDNFCLKREIKKRNINENVKFISYRLGNLLVEIIAIKLIPYIQEKPKKLIISKYIIRSLKNKKILIFGKKSDLGNYINNSNLKNICKIKLLSSKNTNSILLRKNLEKIKPDFIMYFFSPKILNGESKKILKYYENVYLDLPKNIFRILSKFKKNFKIFYPSTIFINQEKKYKFLSSYIRAKKKAEIEFRKKKYKNTFFIKRFPMLKTKSNYNPLTGKYMGCDLDFLKKYLLNFFKFYFE